MKQKIKIVLAVAIGVAFIVSLIYLSNKTKPAPSLPAIITSSPGNHTTEASVFGPIIIVFNQPIVASDVTATSVPEELWSIQQKDANTIELDHQLYLRVASDYTVTINEKGQIVGTISFTTAHEQNDPRYLQGLQSDLDKNYPLSQFTPYETALYRVVYSAPLTLEIDLKSDTLDQATAISQIKSWVQSHGIDPATHAYTVVAPSPTPTPSPLPSPSPESPAAQQ